MNEITLYNDIYEREGNNAWLSDHIIIMDSPIGLIMQHKKNHIGWMGEINETNIIELDRTNIEESQKIINEYIEENSLYITYSSGYEEGIKIFLKDLVKNTK